MVEYILLGFLLYGEMSGYDLRSYMSRSTANFYEASYGSIYPALKRLEAAGCVSVRDEAAGKRVKKLYRILPEGEKRFLTWMESPLELSKHNTEPLLRVFFLSHLERDKADGMLERFYAAQQAERVRLEELQAEVCAEADVYQMETLHFGIEHNRHILRWIEGLRAKLAKADDDSKEGAELI